MKLEQNDLSMIFSTTEISDVFFTEYLSQASGDSIKVYLYILFLSKYGKDVKINDLSKKLSLPLKTIQDSLKYWEDCGVITKKTTGFIVNNLQEVELHKLYKPRVSALADTKKTEENQYRAKAIEAINTSFFQGVMSPSWYNDIDLWFKKYGFDEQVMLALFRYCFERSALHRNYIQTVADAWYKNNIKTFSDLDLYYQKEEKLNVLKKTISKKLGLNRMLTQYEEAYVEKWVVDFGYNIDVIELALKKTTSKANFNFNYIDSILTSWNEHHLKNVTDVQKFLDDSKNKQKNIKELEKKSYQNYEQRKFEDLDSLYANAQKT
jgi:DnaD/phage-associated family protein